MTRKFSFAAVALIILMGIFAFTSAPVFARQPSLMQMAENAASSPGSFQLAEAATASNQAPIISSVHVEGTQRLEPETVTSHISLAKGNVATPEKINESVKSLYATGLFANVVILMEGTTLNVAVEENPVLNRVAYEGNDAISTEDLEKESQIKARQVYTENRVQKDVARILELYRRSGRFGAVVNPKIVKLEQNRVDLVYEITEGKRTGIRGISFVGNSHYESEALKQAISTRESAWWRFLSSSDYYDPDRMNYDKELLRQFYLNQGYVDFRVVSAVAELTPDRDDFYITFTVEEGPRYKFGKMNLTSEIKGLNTDKLRQDIVTHENNWYDADQIEKSVSKLTTVLGDMQYAFVNIVPNPDKHKETLTVDLNYTIKESARVYVDHINVKGNTRTMDSVIRRELRLAEGDPFSITKVHTSEQRLKDLGFFEESKITPVDGTQPDRANLNVDVKEKSTGEVQIGAGFSSTDGPLGDFSISEHNFLGRGQDVRVGATVSGRTQQIDTSFTEPYLFGRDLSAGADLFYVRTDNQDLSSYNTDTAGITFRAGYPLSDELRQKLNYSFHRDTISSVPTTASLYIIDQQGTSVTSSFGQSLIYDTRDSKLDPTLGYITHLDTDVAGAGGSRKWFKTKVGGTQYYPIAEKWVVSGLAEYGQIWGIGSPTKINERFFLGGDTLRGFQYAGIGPRDTTSTYDDALGGTRYGRTSLELSTPTPFPAEFGLKGHIFTDAGVLDKLDDHSQSGATGVVAGNTLHVSAGVGVTWNSPFGPVRLDYGQPIVYKSYDKIEHIHFSFGTKF